MRNPREMEMVIVEEVRSEASGISSILFSTAYEQRWKDMVPGQFLMIWVPGVDEVPMSLSYHFGDPLKIGITVQNIGVATNAICSLKTGDRVGIRGPYGNGFSLPDEGTVIGVSGGVGGASTILPMEWAHSRGLDTINLIGAKNSGSLLFRERFQRSSKSISISTDDGSEGHHGFVTELLEETLKGMDRKKRESTTIFSCGPELMMTEVKRVTDSFDVRGQFSLERFMKCGIGICDSCSISGMRVCMDGPVFTSDQIDGMEEFGRYHRTRSGKMVPIKECVR